MRSYNTRCDTVPSIRWLLLAYKAPQQPSTARAAAWRLLKGAGALYLQQSVCLLPDRPSTREVVERVRGFVEGAEGNATLLEIEGMSDPGERLVQARSNELREAEYRELLDRCAAFFAELRKESRRGNFSFAEVEENEDDLVKLRAWLRKIRARDFFGCELGGKAERAVADCAVALEKFTDRVLAQEAGEPAATRPRLGPRRRRARPSRT